MKCLRRPSPLPKRRPAFTFYVCGHKALCKQKIIRYIGRGALLEPYRSLRPQAWARCGRRCPYFTPAHTIDVMCRVANHNQGGGSCSIALGPKDLKGPRNVTTRGRCCGCGGVVSAAPHVICLLLVHVELGKYHVLCDFRRSSGQRSRAFALSCARRVYCVGPPHACAPRACHQAS